ncbi:hypothetical protein BHYA_0080g00470 [Botrytis hyacinthi]|uniref:Uncharacterized protein n=1 Tax=Botrytis hyacinthi TaxID=278943 RepID=A0A4Z1GRN0_9HELO|nr:hypothetical protein BHYA_0080g00470 [Botrytis hyacinthi]
MKSISQPLQIAPMLYAPLLRASLAAHPLKSISVEPSYQPARRRPSTSLALLSCHPSPGLHKFQLEAHSHSLSLFMQGCEDTTGLGLREEMGRGTR